MEQLVARQVLATVRLASWALIALRSTRASQTLALASSVTSTQTAATLAATTETTNGKPSGLVMTTAARRTRVDAWAVELPSTRRPRQLATELAL